MNSDPTAQVIMKTQMAETERKAKEAQSKMQMDMQKHQQEYQLKVAELEQKVQELMAKYNTQVAIDEQNNATNIALANINNASRERVAQINAMGQLTQQQQQLEHEQNMSAIDAINSADQDIRQHGIQVEQQAFAEQAAQVQKTLDAEQQQRQMGQEHMQSLEQKALETQLQPPQPPQGVL
jgi:hypothetical protein